MADAPQLDRPGVEVVQEFTTQTPTILKASLPACIVGPCLQTIEAVEDDGTLNSDALINTPARLTSPFITSPYELASAGAKALALSVDNNAAVTVTLPGTNPTLDDVADAINSAEISDLLALVETSGSNKRLVIQTVSKGENSSIEVDAGTHATVLSLLALTVGYTTTGQSGYTNYLDMGIQLSDYPDPRANLKDLTIHFDDLRVFLNSGGGIKEALRTESFLQGGSAGVTPADDGDGDNLTPYLDFTGALFKPGPAKLVGIVDLTTTAASFSTGTLILNVDGSAHTVTFASPSNAAAVISQINSGVGAVIASLDGSNHLVLTSTTNGPTSRMERTGGTESAANLGIATGATSYGSPGHAFAVGKSDLTGLTYTTGVNGRVLRMSINGAPYQTLVMPVCTDAADILAAINALWGSIAALDGANFLVLQAPGSFGGVETVIRIDKVASDATLLTSLGLTTSGAPFVSAEAVHGAPFSPKVGDEVWVDGIFLGNITQIPVSPTTRLRISSEVLLSFTGATWSIVAKGLANSAATATRPSSNLIVDENSGTVTVKHELFHDTTGLETKAGPLAVYLGYDALRLDVTPAKTISDFNLLRIGSLDDLDSQLEPIDTTNNLGLGMYFAMLNAPGLEVTGCGVDETTVTAEDGTSEAYARAFEYLESKDIYSIAPMTHDAVTGQTLLTHVVAMSDPSMGLERTGILNPSRPTRKSSTLIASGPKANVSGVPSDTIQTGIANLQALLAAAGVPGPSFDEDDQLYVTFEDDANNYLIQSVSSGALVVNNGPLADNDDGFFLDGGGSSVFDTIVVDRPFTLQIRGDVVGNLTDEATAYADIARGYNNRRIIATAPSQAKSTLEGLETIVEGFYLAAALAGVKSAKAPAQGLTEGTITGFTGVIGSSERYGEIQLRIMDGGGLWVFYQDDDGQPVRVRHQLTTEVGTLVARESSITDALDYAAKTLRQTFKNFIGRFNITTGLQDALNLVASSMSVFFTTGSTPVFASFEIVSITQNADAPDELDLIVDVVTLKPLNKLRITMRVS